MSEPARILVVDDDEGTRDMLVMALTEEGYTVEQAADGEMALERLAEWTPQLIILDLRMPVMSGQQLLAELRCRRPDLPVVLTSADARLLRSTDFDVTGVLVKPFDLDDLLDMVARALTEPDAPGGRPPVR